MKRAADGPPGGGPGAKRAGGGAASAGGARLTQQDALSYLRSVKDRFAKDKHVYDKFLEVMRDFKSKRINTDGVIEHVKDLFRGHRELILGFNTFLPKGYEIEMPEDEDEPKPKQPVEFDQAISYVNKIKTRFADNECVYKAFLEILNMYRKGQKTISQVYDEVALLFQSHEDLLREFTYFLPDATQPQRVPGQPKKGAARVGPGAAKALRAERGAPARAMPGGALKRKAGARAPKEGRGDEYAGEYGAKAGEKGQQAASLAKELAFFEKVKQRLRNREAYQEFLKCLAIFNQEIISKMELQGLVFDILGRFPDLLSAFNDFLARCESMDLEADAGGRTKEGKQLTAKDIQKMKVVAVREKYLSRPISELDLSACDRCGPSYRLLPKGFPKAPASGRNELCMHVLNDDWVSVTSGSEDFSFKAMRKNQYEEGLFRCEDDRFELDMVLETNASCQRALEALSERIEAMSPEDRAAYKVPDGTLNAVQLRAVERIYADHGQDVRELLLRNPAVSIPVVLSRLKQKDEEWRKVREDMRKVWAEVYEKNYNKSLDHRSFYFKQTDKKALSAKGMLAEIKECAEKRKTEPSEDRRALADIVHSYKSAEVHDDVYAVLDFSCHEMLSADQANKITAFWRNFIEPFFSINRSAEGTHVTCDAAARIGQQVREAREAEGSDEDGDGKEGGDKKMKGDDDDEDDEEGAEGGSGTTAKRGRAAAAAMDEDKDDDDDEDEAKPKTPKATASEEGDEFEEEVPDATEAKLYARCKPLAAADGEAGEAAGPPLSGMAARVFFGHDGFYLLFRLHQHLYERLATARVSAVQVAKTWHQRGNGEETKTSEEVRDEFFELLFKLLNSSTEASKYEDECRTLLGANSYMLFTLDKLIFKVVKQLQSLLSDETATKLMLLHDYERSRTVPYRDEVYHANGCMLLNDEQAYRFAVSESADELMISLMEGGPDKSDLPAGVMEAAFADYLRGFVQSVGEVGEDVQNTVYLGRNMPVSVQEAEATKGTLVVNGLECKISCSTSKVSYVLDTEDVFFRPKGRRGKMEGAPGSTALRDVPRFHSWIQDKLAVAALLTEAAADGNSDAERQAAEPMEE